MPTIIDISDKPAGYWFDLEGGGRIQLRPMNVDILKDVRKQTIKRKVEYKRVDGKAERFEIEDINEDLQSELFWDYVIMAWENLLDADEKPIPCTKENKMLLLTHSAKFVAVINEALRKITEDEDIKLEEAEKN